MPLILKCDIIPFWRGFSYMNGCESIRPVVFVDETKCVNCHRCISVCPVKFCNDGSSGTVKINHELCIGCGACIEECIHGARYGVDDTKAFFDDLRAGKKIVAIVAPAVAANFFGKDLELNGYLKSIGVKAVFDVSFGAELTTKSYVEDIKKNKPPLMIAQPCPSLVTYIETYHPKLIPYLAKSDSPMAHTAIMIRNFYHEYDDCKIAAISPCFAKRREFDENKTVDYNVTMKSLDTYFESNGIDLSSFPRVDYDNPCAERAVLYSTPGGLVRTAERYVPGITTMSHKIEGNPDVIDYLAHLDACIQNGKMPGYVLVDCLYCSKGCNLGGGTTAREVALNNQETFVEKRASERRKKLATSSCFSKNRMIKRLHRVIDKYWNDEIYKRNYIDRSAVFRSFIKEPDQSELEEVFHKMGKDSQSRRNINCRACGYETCRQMAVAIFNNLNRPENCHFYVTDRARSLRDEFKNELSDSVSRVTNESVQMLKTTDSDMETLLSHTDEMAKSVGDSSKAVEEMISNVRSIASVIEHNFESVSKLEEATKSGNENLLEVNKLVSVIEGESKSLMDMGRMVGQIASQTNLLAMNAAIEAAHAGEIGAGFAVVADEIRKLAEDSSKQSKQIGEVLKRIKGLIDTAYDKTGTAQKEFSQVVDLSDEVKIHETQIKESITYQADDGQKVLLGLEVMQDGVSSVMRAAKELKASTDEVISQISNINL